MFTLTWHIVNAEHPPTLINALLQALSLQETCRLLYNIPG